MCSVVVPSSWVTVMVWLSLSESLAPGLHRLTVSVRSSVRSGWWVSTVSGGIGMLSDASRLTSTLTAWTAWPTPTGMEKEVSPSGTNGTLACDAPVAATSVPVMPVTPASMSAVSVTLSCPATVWSSTGCSMPSRTPTRPRR